ncbi:hypothetical protein L3Y34_010102 [Caenorhabditis briggsae]|uniref:DUF38 domain-containing protein n=1 Tax=Caenorhabditis briggsae TaxID=6238 RepID=A0AAE9ABL5_CAEBR|nr:hypothetical protein L3Y34_010102 [Caenorhabditis briggsae]
MSQFCAVGKNHGGPHNSIWAYSEENTRRLKQFNPFGKVLSTFVVEISTEIYMIVNFLNPEGSPLDIRYGAERGKTVVVKNAISKTRKEKVFENENFVDMFCNDFSILQRFISHQKVPMDEVSFKIFREDHAGTFAKIGSMLSKGKPLTTRKIALKVYRVEEIMAIFPYVAPGVLKDNYFEQSRMGITRNSHQLNLTDVAKLEQWKKADTVEIKDFTVRYPSRFLHFSRVDTCFRTISMEDIESLKNAFLKDDTPEFFEISAEAPEEHLYFEHVMKKMGGDWTEERNRDQLRRFRQVTPVGNKDKVATFLLFYSSLKLERNCLSED